MAKKCFNVLMLIVCFPMFVCANEELPIDTRRQIFIYETIRDYKPKNHHDVESAISDSFLSGPEREELLLSLERQSKLLFEIAGNMVFPLLHRSIPSNYALNEIISLEKSGKISVGLSEFIYEATHEGFSLDGAIEFIREQIKIDKEKNKNRNVSKDS